MSTATVYGRWDLRILHPDGEFPSWFELTPDGGRFVGRVGSARPITSYKAEGDHVEFSLPKQYEGRETDLKFEGVIRAGMLEGSCLSDEGNLVPFVGIRAPESVRVEEPVWGEPVELIGKDLSNWTLRSPDWESHWSVTEAGLHNAAVGSDLITRDKFGDFKLIAEYRYPKGSNSGIYLRGRYEFQIMDDFGHEPSVGSSGAIYGFLKPPVQAIHAPEEWNTAEITLVGRNITVVLNGTTLFENEEIPGITGGALDSDEAKPGPLFVQGDHGPVTFRRLTLFPIQ